VTTLSPASQKLLRELARRDKGDGIAVRYSGRGRWSLDGGNTAFNRASFSPLFEASLVTGWDEYDDDGPMRITDAGRTLAAELEQQAVAKEAAKKDRAKPNPDGPTALRLLREIAKRGPSALVYGDMRRRRVWHLDSHKGYSASVDTWLALSGASYIHIEYGFAGGKRVSVTDAGLKRIAPAAAVPAA
jgi:hypothetical protein